MLEIIPVELSDANDFIAQYHRHHKPVCGWKFGLAAYDGTKIVGVATIGRPTARYLDDGLTLEVTRVATDGAHNACSFLYGAARRATFALGYKKLITYTLKEESGSSLRGAGWICIGEAGGGNWNCKSRPRIDSEHQQKKLRWEVYQ